MSIIRIEKLSKIYKEAEEFAVNNIDLTVSEGEVFGLLGPNGAGKTTLISMLCGLLKPTAGKIEINGYSYGESRKQIQQFIGVVPQEYALYPTMTALENLQYYGAMYNIPKQKLKKRIADGLEQLGLMAFADKKVETYSGGMKRRLNLLIGIIHRPRILFLDEPTVGVDVQSKKAIMQYLSWLNTNGTTIIYTSHHLNEAEDFCSHIAIIDNGNIITQGTPKELIYSTSGTTSLEEVFIELTGKDLRDYA